MDKLFAGLFDTQLTQNISLEDFLICLAASVFCGILLAAVFSFGAQSSRSFSVTLGLIPAVVCVVIMMVNGNIGAGVAVAGAFSLVRFRSAPGTASEIATLFLAMGAGLITGMGYLAYAALFTLIMCAVLLLYRLAQARMSARQAAHKTLTVTIPEDLCYTEVFTDIWEEYTDVCELTRVKTTNMGSMLRLSYHVTLREPQREKELIDALRCRNGNLEISVSSAESAATEL